MNQPDRLFKFSVIGDPVEHSLSPLLFRALGNQLGLELTYNKIKIAKEDLPGFFHNLQQQIEDYDGVNITIPHKHDVLKLLEKADRTAKIIQAVNCVKLTNAGVTGTNTDWIGFIENLKEGAVSVEGKQCVILGAGGVARAVIYAISRSGVKELAIVNRTIERAFRLSELIQAWDLNFDVSVHPLEDSQRLCLDSEVIINCTSVGMTPGIDRSPIPVQFVQKEHILIDTIYTPLETQFLKFGKLVHATVLNGLGMFIAQGIASLEYWLGRTVRDQINVKLLRQEIIREL
ncbi:MAG: shikimate dehydrogenase [Candidatus Neomarinimicrobiota bacterium]